jgi:hydroxymethylbilane synthase
MRDVLTIATRGTELALAQTQNVISLLKEKYPGMRIKIKKVAAEGDKDTRTVLWELKATGFFTSLLEDALAAGEADFAVHSFKDMPTKEREGLTIAAVCERRWAEDCLIGADSPGSIEQLKDSARIGTSSLRRMVQIKNLRKDLKPVPVRGSVLTRIRRLEEGKFDGSTPLTINPEHSRRIDAIILARAGMERLGLGEKISFCFDPQRFIPAPAQGALAVQVRKDDVETSRLISAINDEKTRVVTLAERRILLTMRCGCHTPVGAFAKIVGDDIIIWAFVSDLTAENFIRRQIAGPIKDAEKLAEKLANELLQAGGRKILENLKE